MLGVFSTKRAAVVVPGAKCCFVFRRTAPMQSNIKEKILMIYIYILRCISRDGDGFFRVATSCGCRGYGSS